MSNDTMVTVHGWVGSHPQVWDAGGAQVTKFRIACTPRRFHRATGEWVDGPTQWYGVSAWRTLGSHCSRSLRTGDPVLVHGRLSQRPYTNKAGQAAIALEIDALSVGHDLSLGIASFTKTVGTAQRRDFERSVPATASEAPTVGAGEAVAAAVGLPPSWSVPGASFAPPEPMPRPGDEPEPDGAPEAGDDDAAGSDRSAA